MMKTTKGAEKGYWNSIQKIKKLLMNGLYGKLCTNDTFEAIRIWAPQRTSIDPITNEHTTINSRQSGSEILTWHTPINEYDELCTFQNTTNESFSPPMPHHISIQVLAYSKLWCDMMLSIIDAMNRPVVIYSDTDSFFMSQKFERLLNTTMVNCVKAITYNSKTKTWT